MEKKTPSWYKIITPTDLFNILQDFRFHLIIDCRNKLEHDLSSIPRSIHCNPEEVDMKQIAESYDGNIKFFEKWEVNKLIRKPIRRLVFIVPSEILCDQIKISILDPLQNLKYKIDKTLVCVDFSSFQHKYPFLCPPSLHESALLFRGGYPKDHEILYAISNFPSEIIEKKLFIGKSIHFNSQRLLNDLQIKCVLDFDKYTEEKLKEKIDFCEKNKVAYINFSYLVEENMVVDFKKINEVIDNAIVEHSCVLISDNYIKSPALVVAYHVEKLKCAFTVASLKIFSILGSTEVDKQIYSQVLSFKPQYQTK